jgi:cytochrome oxidase Cu insertion factor (SCO1/SenC/PrrC family)
MNRLQLLLSVVAQLASQQGHAAATVSLEVTVQTAIRAAGASSAMGELTALVRTASACCESSVPVSNALSQWLRENHPIHAGRLPTETSQFRGFLTASLSAFPPNKELYLSVRSDFLFGGHAFNIAAAAVAARSFPDKSEELLPLMERFLDSSFNDPAVDLTTPDLRYPPAHPTRARYEIIRTMMLFGSLAWRSLPLLDAAASVKKDPELARRAAEAAAHIRKVTPSHCRKPAPTVVIEQELELIEKGQRKRINAGSVRLLDQDGKMLTFGDLRGRPFVLTFFYSQCTNQLKCVSTVRQLQFLSESSAKDGLADRIGIYGMTYDAHFDTPSILRQYGKLHGLKFRQNVRLLKAADPTQNPLGDQLNLRVSYGAGSVNQHGIQLFVFDKTGRVAVTLDNEIWSPAAVKNTLAKLAAE